MLLFQLQYGNHWIMYIQRLSVLDHHINLYNLNQNCDCVNPAPQPTNLFLIPRRHLTNRLSFRESFGIT